MTVLTTRTGKIRPVCHYCGRKGRAVTPEPTADGYLRVGLFDLSPGWSVAPYPATVVHPNGTTGDVYRCGACEDLLHRQGYLSAPPSRVLTDVKAGDL